MNWMTTRIVKLSKEQQNSCWKPPSASALTVSLHLYMRLIEGRMRRAFLRTFGQPPQVIRRNARAETTA